MKHYDTTFFVDEESKGLQVFIQKEESDSYPYTIRINSADNEKAMYAHPSVIFFIKSGEQLDRFLNSVEREAERLADQALAEQIKSISKTKEL